MERHKKYLHWVDIRRRFRLHLLQV